MIDYRKHLKETVETLKKSKISITYGRMAGAMKIYPPFLTKVMKQEAHLNPDQLYLGAQYLKLPPSSTKYLMLLREWTTTEVPYRKELLEKEINEIQKTELKTESHLGSDTPLTEEQRASYYLNPLAQIIHMALSLPLYSKKPPLITKNFGLSKTELNETIELLLELGLVEKGKSGEFKTTQKSLHLSKDSPLCRPQQLSTKIRSAYHLAEVKDDSQYSFCVTFSSTEEVKNKIQKLFLALLSEFGDLVDNNATKEVYQMNFDLFNWRRN